MIVVMIIGILLAIAVPNFVLSRHATNTKACISNLKEIYSAKQQWAMDNGKSGSSTPAATDLFGTGKYIVQAPSCPTTGVAYDATLGTVDANPTCPNPSVDGGGNYDHVLP
jgi:type II secretory pathway pseudopilin PulG